MSDEIKCWTKWLNENFKNLKNLNFKEIFGQRVDFFDTDFGWTAAHSIAGASPSFSIKIVRKIFSYLATDRGRLERQLCKRDNDGDIPLQSCINSGAPAETVRLILTIAPAVTKKMLLSKNEKGETPLRSAFEQQEWGAVEVIIEFCIKYKVLSDLTGVHFNKQYSNTLLHCAFKRGYVKHLEILLKVCHANNVKNLPVLLILNKKKETAWYHLTNRSTVEQQEALSLVVQYGINVNQLYLDSTKSTMLHRAYRRGNKEIIDLLQNFDANENQTDCRGLIPRERTRSLSSSIESRTGSPEPQTQSDQFLQDQPAPTTHNQLAPTTQDQLAPTVQDQPAPTTQDQPALTTQDQPAPSIQDQLAPITQDQPAPTTQDQTGLTAQDQLVPTTQDQTGFTAQDQLVPTTQDQTGFTAQDQPAPTTQDQPAPTTQDQTGLTVQDQPASATQDQTGFIAQLQDWQAQRLGLKCPLAYIIDTEDTEATVSLSDSCESYTPPTSPVALAPEQVVDQRGYDLNPVTRDSQH